MRIVIIILIVIVTLVIIMILIGRMLPVKHTVSQSHIFRSSTDDVWKVVSNINEWKAWRSDLKNLEITSATTFKADNVDYSISNSVPGVSFTTIIVTKDLPYGGSWNYVFEKEGSGCKLTVTENGEVFNPLFRFLSKYVFGHEGSMKSFMQSLTTRIQ
jgi:hypothetical protein